MKLKKYRKRIVWCLAIGFIGLNTVAYLHAYKFTHFATASVAKTQSPEKLGTADKLQALLLGINNPRPVNTTKPSRAYKNITIASHKTLECWYIPTDSAKGTVILYHGYSGSKSTMLDKAEAFYKLGYNTLLVDFMGSGGSDGNQTTIGFKEAQEVKSTYDYIQSQGEPSIILMGTSMGAVAIMKALKDYNLKPQSIILECPFGSMYQTTCARFKVMKAPTFPMAGLLVFWGGVQNGFWAFGHQPTAYAKAIHCPTLLLYGEKDLNVSRPEIDAIYTNLQGPKTLITYPLAGHENYLTQYKDKWLGDVKAFLGK